MAGLDLDNDSAIEVSNSTTPPVVAPMQRKSSFFERFFQRKSPSPIITHNNSMESLPPLSPLTLSGYHNSRKHKLLQMELADNIRNLLPPRMQLYDNWHLVYSTDQHGISLNTLYRNCDLKNQLALKKKTHKEIGFADNIVSNMISSTPSYVTKPANGYILIVKDKNNNKFGAYLNETLKPMDHKRYYGNGECFLWKCEQVNSNDDDHIRFKAFMYTGLNDNVIFSNSNFIAIGSSNGENGLYIDKSLYSGVSYRCETFGNEVLSSSDPESKFGKFEILSLEVWRVGDLS